MGRIDRAYYIYQQCTAGAYGTLAEYAKRMRKEPTPAEALPWKFLRGSRQAGLHFRRQHILTRYIVDFVCLVRWLIIELDGPIHDKPEQQAWDAERTRQLEEKGFEIIRFRNEQALHRRQEVIDTIVAAALARPHRPEIVYPGTEPKLPFP